MRRDPLTGLASRLFPRLRHRRVGIGARSIALDLGWPHERAYYDFARRGKLAGATALDSCAIECFLRAGDHVLDAGANIGFTALMFLRQGAAHVYAFEPDPRNYARLASLRDAQLSVYPQALGDSSVESRLVLSVTHNQGSTLRPDVVRKFASLFAGARTVGVPVTTIDEALAGKRLDFWKIDVEGGEAALLRGAHGILASSPPRVIVLEVFDEFVAEVEAILRPLFGPGRRLAVDRASGSLAQWTPREAAEADRDRYFLDPPTYVYSRDGDAQ